MHKIRFIPLLLGAAFLLMTCVSSGDVRPASAFPYVIENHNWNQATVTFFCGDELVKRERGLSTGEQRIGVLRRAHCDRPRFVITFLGSSEVLRSDPIIGWAPDVALVIVIENATNLSSHHLRAA